MPNPNAWLPSSQPAWRSLTVAREIHAVARINKLRDRLQSRFSERNFAFEDLRAILLSLGFDERVRGSHHIFARSGIAEIVNLQPVGRLAKPYQVRQVRELIKRHGLLGGRDDG
jgi:predicted RNA binding protein YcfA (HicA-like mRNA interferase family)